MRNVLIPLAMTLALGGAAYAQDKPAGDAGAADPAMKVASATFARQVASSNAFEIRSSQIALDKLPDGPLRTFAQQMIDDHGKAGAEFKATLEAAGKQLPPQELAPKHAAMIKLLEGASGGDAAMLYTDMQFGAHKEAVALFMTFTKAGDDKTIQDFAAKTLPTLEMHLMHVKAMVEDKPS